jgi:hypothetical protein
MSDAKKPRKKNVPVTGKQVFTDRDAVIFGVVLDHYIEVHTARESGAIMAMRVDVPTPLDFLITVDQVVRQASRDGLLNRAACKNWLKLSRGIGTPIGTGSRNRLIQVLSKKFLAARLFPLVRFFSRSEESWKYTLSKQRAMMLSLTPSQIATIKTAATPERAVGVLRFDDNTPLIIARDPWDTQEPDADTGFARQQEEVVLAA